MSIRKYFLFNKFLYDITLNLVKFQYELNIYKWKHYLYYQIYNMRSCHCCTTEDNLAILSPWPSYCSTSSALHVGGTTTFATL